MITLEGSWGVHVKEAWTFAAVRDSDLVVEVVEAWTFAAIIDLEDVWVLKHFCFKIFNYYKIESN